MYRRGLVIGKFYPPHLGHSYLIQTARAACDELTVIVCWKREETIPGALRAQWIQRLHPDVRVMTIEDNKLADDDSEGWAKCTLEILGYVPDAVFTSEAYGDPYASFMGTVHVLVDRERTVFPVSGTKVRSDPVKYSEFLAPPVRAYFARRVCILGAESTGTTTLSQDLAKCYNTVWVPEYGRMYAKGKQHAKNGTEWRSEEFEAIAHAQSMLEDSLAEASNGLVICDTNAFATGIWHERYKGVRSSVVEKIAAQKTYDAYIVTGDEIPFVQDGTRDGEHVRHDMHRLFVQRLTEAGKNFTIVTGGREERLRQAVEIIDAMK